MGSVLGHNKSMDNDPSQSCEEPTMSTLPTLDQTVAGPDPTNDLAYLQEKLLRDKFLKIMSYTQKKKKKKKKDKERDKNLPQDNTPLPDSVAKVAEAQNSNAQPSNIKPDDTSPSSFLLKALTGLKPVEAYKPEVKLTTAATAKATSTNPKSLSSSSAVMGSATLSRGSTSTASSSSSTSKGLPPVKSLSKLKTYCLTEKRCDWFNRDVDEKVFSSSDDDDDSETKVNGKPAVEIAKQNGSGNTAVPASSTLKKLPCFSSNAPKLKSIRTLSTTTATTSKSNTADEYEFSDNDDDSVFLSDAPKTFSKFKLQTASSISTLVKNSTLLTNGSVHLKSNFIPSAVEKQTLDNKEIVLAQSTSTVIKSAIVEKPSPILNNLKKVDSASSSGSVKSLLLEDCLAKNDSTFVKTYSRAKSNLSESDGSVIWKGSSSSLSSSETNSPRKARSDSESSGMSDTRYSLVEKPANQIGGACLMEYEPDPVCTPDIAMNRTRSLIQDEILGDGESGGVKTPEVQDQDDPPSKQDTVQVIPPVLSTCVKYKSNRYYKPEQSAILWEFYQQNQYPTKPEQAMLAEKVGGVEVRRILWWFTHRRRTDKNKPEFQLAAPPGKAVKVKQQPEILELGPEVSLACGVTNTCSICQFTEVRPKLLRHLRSAHGFKATVCRRCQKIWQQTLFDLHPCPKKKGKKSPAKNKTPAQMRDNAILIESITPIGESVSKDTILVPEMKPLVDASVPALETISLAKKNSDNCNETPLGDIPSPLKETQKKTTPVKDNTTESPSKETSVENEIPTVPSENKRKNFKSSKKVVIDNEGLTTPKDSPPKSKDTPFEMDPSTPIKSIDVVEDNSADAPSTTTPATTSPATPATILKTLLMQSEQTLNEKCSLEKTAVEYLPCEEDTPMDIVSNVSSPKEDISENIASFVMFHPLEKDEITTASDDSLTAPQNPKSESPSTSPIICTPNQSPHHKSESATTSPIIATLAEDIPMEVDCPSPLLDESTEPAAADGDTAAVDDDTAAVDDDNQAYDDSALFPIGFGTRCSSCAYDGPNILRHFKAIHDYSGKKCRKCGHFWLKEQIDGHPCAEQPSRMVERPRGKVTETSNTRVAATLTGQPKPRVTTPIKKVNKDADQKIEYAEISKLIFKTPTKKDLSAPTQFYSRRYKELLSQFSPKKLSCNDLKDMMQSSRFLRNGKLDLNYITPKQLEAVQDFMIGDRSLRVRNSQ